MIEEKMIISFTEYLSCFDDEGEYVDDYAKESEEHCIKAINEAVNRFIAGASTIAHHGFNLGSNNFHAEVYVSIEDGYVSLNIICGECSEVTVSYCFETTTDLVLTKSFNVVSIE